MEYYSQVKLLHVSTVVISLILFISRVLLLLKRPTILKHPALRILPHINDSILLFSAVSLLILAELTPGSDNPWLVAKIIAMIIYILTGMFLLKWASTTRSILSLFFLALIIYFYIIHTAIYKNINPFLY